MAEATQPIAANGKFHFHLLFPFIFSPRKVFQQILVRKATWLTPLLVVSLILLGQVVFNTNRSPAGVMPVMPTEQPLESAPAIEGAVTELIGGGGGGGGGGGDSSGTVDGAVTVAGASAGMTIALNAAKEIGGLWLGWFILTAVLYVALVVSGGQGTFTQSLNLVAWSSLPFGIQALAQIVFVLAYPASSGIPQGLTGLVAQMQGTGGTILGLILQDVNIFLIWQAVLVGIGVTFISQITGRKAFWLVLIAFVLYLLLAALPAFAMSQLSTLQNAASPQY